MSNQKKYLSSEMNEKNNSSVLWKEILNDLIKSSEEVASYLEKHDGIELSLSIKERAIVYWRIILPSLLKNDGERFINLVNTLLEAYFPQGDNFIDAFKKIYYTFFNPLVQGDNSLPVRIQKESLREFIAFIITPETKAIMPEIEKKLLSKIVELFKNSVDLTITETALKNLRRSQQENIEDIIRHLIKHLHLETETVSVYDNRIGRRKKIKVYRFSRELIEFLLSEGVLKKVNISNSDSALENTNISANEKNVVSQEKSTLNTENTELKNNVELNENQIIINNIKDKKFRIIVSNQNIFNIDLFYAIILADIAATERYNVNPYIKVGIVCQIALLFLLGTQINLNREIERIDNGLFLEKLKNQGFDIQNMNVIPKSWMMDSVLEIYLVDFIKAIAYIIGGPSWVPRPEVIKKYKRLFKQLLTRLPKINTWKLGQKVRIQIPILIKIGGLVAEVFGAKTSYK
ncbi:MAG: hypothetical protein ACTSXF_09990 [Promethearchaeota archaeon]